MAARGRDHRRARRWARSRLPGPCRCTTSSCTRRATSRPSPGVLVAARASSSGSTGRSGSTYRPSGRRRCSRVRAEVSSCDHPLRGARSGRCASCRRSLVVLALVVALRGSRCGAAIGSPPRLRRIALVALATATVVVSRVPGYFDRRALLPDSADVADRLLRLDRARGERVRAARAVRRAADSATRRICGARRFAVAVGVLAIAPVAGRSRTRPGPTTRVQPTRSGGSRPSCSHGLDRGVPYQVDVRADQIFTGGGVQNGLFRELARRGFDTRVDRRTPISGVSRRAARARTSSCAGGQHRDRRRVARRRWSSRRSSVARMRRVAIRGLLVASSFYVLLARKARWRSPRQRERHETGRQEHSHGPQSSMRAGACQPSGASPSPAGASPSDVPCLLGGPRMTRIDPRLGHRRPSCRPPTKRAPCPPSTPSKPCSSVSASATPIFTPSSPCTRPTRGWRPRPRTRPSARATGWGRCTAYQSRSRIWSTCRAA